MSEVCAGIVTYQPEIDVLRKNLSSIASQVDLVVIVDNHSNNIFELDKIVVSFPNVIIIKNKQNSGIAKALNQMCEFADQKGYKWILTLDQDTIIPVDMVKKFQNYTRDESIGIICPSVFYEGWNEELKNRGTVEYIKACMTSASLTKVNAWKKVGGFCEDFFIDYVDNEFCMKLNLEDYKILRVNNCIIKHRLGESGVKEFGFVKIKYTKHSPIRLYYMTRNNLLFIDEYRSYLFVEKEYLKLLYVLFKELMFSDKKREVLCYIRQGVDDAKNKIMGEYNKLRDLD